MGRSAKYRKQVNLDPLWNKNASTDQYQIWQGWPCRGAHSIGEKKIGGRLSGGAPTRWPFVKLLWLSSPPFFPRADHRSEATFANDVVCIKRRGSVYTRAFWGKWLPKFIFWGSPLPKTAKIFPQTGKSHLKLECVITFKRREIDKKSQWNTNRKSVIGFQNLLTILTCDAT